MPSPFPGMDPYLEAPEHWDRFQSGFVPAIQARINAQLGPRYSAHLRAYTAYEEPIPGAGGEDGEAAARTLSFVDLNPTAALPTTVGGTRPTPAPVIARVPEEQRFRLLRVHVKEVQTGRMVTLIEVLSPINKMPGAHAYEQYLQKRRALFRSRIHLLEVDLLRGGVRPPLASPVPGAPYYVTLRREQRHPFLEVWPIQLADRLPVVPVPLLAPDPDVPLDLQAAVTAVYEQGAFARVLDYNVPPPPPPLSPEEAKWVAQLLAGPR